MSDYRRWISYIYLYENGVKKENAGYARIELQDGRVKLAMYINRARRDGVVDACYFKNQAGHFGVARLGEIDLSEPSPVFRHEGDASNMGGSGLFFQELNGILLTGRNGSYYASSWEDAPVSAADVEEIRKLLSHSKEKPVSVENIGQEQKESSVRLSENVEISKEQEPVQRAEREQTTKTAQQSTQNRQASKTEPPFKVMQQSIAAKQPETVQSPKTVQQKMAKQPETEQSSKTVQQKMAKQSETEQSPKTVQQKTERQPEIEQLPKTVQQKVMEEQNIKNRQQESEQLSKAVQTGQQEPEQLFKMVQQNVASEQAERNSQLTKKVSSDIEVKDAGKLKEQEVLQEMVQQKIENEPSAERIQNSKESTKQEYQDTMDSNYTKAKQVSEEIIQSMTDRQGEHPIAEPLIQTVQQNIINGQMEENKQQDAELSDEFLTEETKAQPASSCVRPVRTSTKEQALTAGCRNVSCSLNREERIFYCLPPMYPFEDGEFEKGVRLEPQDIGMLPKNVWKLAGNSFLLHAFYTYHHLLFMRKRQKEGTVCYLMLPGVYDKKEQRMAQMFGFSNFRPVKCQQLDTGVFGYWYMEIRF